MSITERLSDMAKFKNIAILLSIQFALQFLILFSFYPKIMAFSNGMQPLDMRLYSAKDAYFFLEALGNEGRRIYLLNELIPDMIFPVAYGLAYGSLLFALFARVLKKQNHAMKIAAIPFMIAVSDLRGRSDLYRRARYGAPS